VIRSSLKGGQKNSTKRSTARVIASRLAPVSGDTAAVDQCGLTCDRALFPRECLADRSRQCLRFIKLGLDLLRLVLLPERDLTTKPKYYGL
jgi:hypothetical protein